MIVRFVAARSIMQSNAALHSTIEGDTIPKKSRRTDAIRRGSFAVAVDLTQYYGLLLVSVPQISLEAVLIFVLQAKASRLVHALIRMNIPVVMFIHPNQTGNGLSD